MNRRKFLSYMGCGCCGIILPSCTTAPITERKQLKLIPEHKLNAQAKAIYEEVKKKEKLSDDKKKLNEIKEIGKKMENAIGEYFIKVVVSQMKSVFFVWVHCQAMIAYDILSFNLHALNAELGPNFFAETSSDTKA